MKIGQKKKGTRHIKLKKKKAESWEERSGASLGSKTGGKISIEQFIPAEEGKWGERGFERHYS